MDWKKESLASTPSSKRCRAEMPRMRKKTDMPSLEGLVDIDKKITAELMPNESGPVSPQAPIVFRIS